MDPSQRRLTAAGLQNQACQLKARALQAQAKRLERQAGLAQRAALNLEAETGGLETYERLRAFQAGREPHPEPQGPKRESTEKPTPESPPEGRGVEHHPWLVLYPHLHARVQARGRGNDRTR